MKYIYRSNTGLYLATFFEGPLYSLTSVLLWIENLGLHTQKDFCIKLWKTWKFHSSQMTMRCEAVNWFKYLWCLDYFSLFCIGKCFRPFVFWMYQLLCHTTLFFENDDLYKYTNASKINMLLCFSYCINLRTVIRVSRVSNSNNYLLSGLPSSRVSARESQRY